MEPAADGADTIDGGAEQDRIRVPSSSADDSFEVSARLTHVQLKAELACSPTLTSLEVIDLGAATGADEIYGQRPQRDRHDRRSSSTSAPRI